MGQYVGYRRLSRHRCIFKIFYKDSFEMQADSIKPGQSVVVIDDLIATGILCSLFDLAF
jgi:adenine/guanine phosphoribosyltransferase-like PRPP-binding protein